MKTPLTPEQLTDAMHSVELRLVTVERAVEGNTAEMHGFIESLDRMRGENIQFRQNISTVASQLTVIVTTQGELLKGIEPLKALGSQEDAKRILVALADRQKTWREVMAKAREEAVQWAVRGVIGIFLLGVYQWVKQHSGQ